MSEQAYGDQVGSADEWSGHESEPAVDRVDEVHDPIEAPGRTGVPRVDVALEALDRLDELPLEEHVSVFESAHAELRRALDANPTGDAMARVANAGTDS